MSSYYASVILADSPVSYWRLNESSGTTAADSADSNPGTYTGGYTLNQAALISNDPTAASVLMNGSTGYVNVPNASNLKPSDVSVECWIKVASASGTQGLVGKWLTNGYLVALLSGSVYVYINGTSIHATCPTGSPVYVVGTYDGTDSRLYVNGALVAGPTAATLTNITGGLAIGQEGNGNGGFLNGNIAEVAVYNYALTAAQVSSHYAARNGAPSTAAGSFTFTASATGTVVYPATGSGSYTFSGTAAGTPTITGTASGVYSFVGSATGSGTTVATATGSYAFAGSAAAHLTIPATGAGSFAFVGVATGSYPQPPPLPTATGYPAGSGLKPFTYCFYQALTGQYLGQLPLSQVTFGSQLLQPGQFSGTIDTASQAVQNLGVFDLIQPGKTALLIDYLGSFIWGGIIWTAPYQQDDTKRQIQVGATEIWSWVQNQRVQATDYSAPPYSGITGNSAAMGVWDATLTAVGDGGPGVFDPTLIGAQLIYDAMYNVPNGNLFGGTGLAINGYPIEYDGAKPSPSVAAAYLASGTATDIVDYISVNYPYSSLQQLGSILNQIAVLGLGVGYDYGVDVAGAAGGPVACTVNLSYPRRGRLYSQNNLVLDCQRMLAMTVPPDATQTGNTMYEQGANGALSVSQNTQPLAGNYPILERIMSRSNIQSANVMEVLQQTGAADLALYSYPLYTPQVTQDLFQGSLQLGQFIVGDDVWWRVPKTNGAGQVFCPRFPSGLDTEARIIGYQATVADAGTSTLQVTLSEPPSFTVQGPWLP